MAIRRYATTSITQAEAKDILQKSSLLLQSADWNGDCACPVELTLESLDPQPFQTGNGVVASEKDFNDLFEDVLPSSLAPAGMDPDLAPRIRQVRIVSEIYWCGAQIGSAAGCADQPGLRIAVARRSALIEGELWAHETGHTRGLPHRNDIWTAVMHEAILPDHKVLNVAECFLYKR